VTPSADPVLPWPSGLTAITLFVEDLAASREFYSAVFGLEPVFVDDTSTAFRFPNTIINLLQVAAADELIGPAEVGRAGTPSRLQLTIEVDDVDATCALLAERGVELLNGPIDRPWGVRTASFRDPSGHIWEIGA